MIWDSHPWKRELRRLAGLIRRLAKDVNGQWEKNDYALERAVMVGFYSIRKLIEAMKLTTACAKMQVPLISYPLRTGKKPTIHHLNWHRINEFYDLGVEHSKNIRLLSLCNMFVHSYIFIPNVDEHGNIVSIFFNSDKTKYSCLYSVEIETIAALFNDVASNSPNQIRIIKVDAVTDDLRRHFAETGKEPIEQDGYLYIYE